MKTIKLLLLMLFMCLMPAGMMAQDDAPNGYKGEEDENASHKSESAIEYVESYQKQLRKEDDGNYQLVCIHKIRHWMGNTTWTTGETYTVKGMRFSPDMTSMDRLQTFIRVYNTYDNDGSDFDLHILNDLKLNNHVLPLDANQVGSLNEWVSLGNSSHPYKGTFYGGGHTISGLYTAVSSGANAGLLGYTSNACIKNINIKDSYFSNTFPSNNVAVAMLIGKATNTKIINCHTDGVCNAGPHTTVSGLVGIATDVSIDHCTTSATCEYIGDSYVGGLVGMINNSSAKEITACAATGKFKHIGTQNTLPQQLFGALCGGISGAVLKYCYSSAESNTENLPLIGNAVNTEAVNCHGVVTSILGDESQSFISDNVTAIEKNDAFTGKLVHLLNKGLGEYEEIWYQYIGNMQPQYNRYTTITDGTTFQSLDCRVIEMKDDKDHIHYTNIFDNVGDDIYYAYDNAGYISLVGKGDLYDNIWVPYAPLLPKPSSRTFTLDNRITRIGSQDFNWDCRILNLPDELREIGDKAFDRSDLSVMSGILPSKLTRIGDYAFTESPMPEKVVIPSSVSYLGIRSFKNCVKVKEIDLSTNENIKEIPYAFAEFCKDLERIHLPADVQKIDADAFFGTKIDNLTLPASVSFIGNNAFNSVKTLQLHSIPLMEHITYAPSITIDLLDHEDPYIYLGENTKMYTNNITSIKYKRSKGADDVAFVEPGTYATVYLPFIPEENERLAYYEFGGYDVATEKVTFIEVEQSQLQANTPYIVTTSAEVEEGDAEDLEFSCITPANISNSLPEEEEHITTGFYGTYVNKTLSGTDGYYGFSTLHGDFRRASNEGNLCGKFRAYYRLVSDSGAAPMKLGVNFSDNAGGTATEINASDIDFVPAHCPIYNLNGTLMGTSRSTLSPGIYIQNGRKFVKG